MNGMNYAKITETRHGWRAEFRCDVEYPLHSEIAATRPRPFIGTHDRSHPRWRRSRKGIERVSSRVLTRLDERDRFDRERERFEIRGTPPEDLKP